MTVISDNKFQGQHLYLTYGSWKIWRFLTGFDLYVGNGVA